MMKGRGWNVFGISKLCEYEKNRIRITDFWAKINFFQKAFQMEHAVHFCPLITLGLTTEREMWLCTLKIGDWQSEQWKVEGFHFSLLCLKKISSHSFKTFRLNYVTLMHIFIFILKMFSTPQCRHGTPVCLYQICYMEIGYILMTCLSIHWWTDDMTE